ncbi:SAM-dependent methyltransferase [Candidatus Omnitrophota bacterium]
MIYREDEKTIFLLNPYHRASPQKLSRLDGDEALILEKMTGGNDVQGISRSLEIPEKDVARIINKFSALGRSAVELLDRPKVRVKAAQRKEAKHNKIFRQMRSELFSTRTFRADNGTTKEYHQKEIADAMEHFNRTELTVSHIFREPNALLQGKNYGAAFAEVLINQGAIRKGISILEVGGGTGIFGKNFLDQIKGVAPEIYKTIRYVFFELSPALLKSQRKISRDHLSVARFIKGDVSNYDFRDEKFNLIISNEMVADLGVVKFRTQDFKQPARQAPDQNKAVDIINRYKIDISDAPDEFLFNLKAIEFLIFVKKILNPGGKAYIVEYGSPWGYPKATVLKGHVEYSIHFGHLKRVAQKLRMFHRLTCLTDFLGFDKKVKILDSLSRSMINDYLLPFLNHKGLSQQAYTEDGIKEEIGDVFNRLSFASFSPLGTGNFILDPSVFFALELKA